MQEEEAHNLEQVAEAALLSIGAVLEWTPGRSGIGPPETWEYAELDINDYFCAYYVGICLHKAPLAKVSVGPLNKDTGEGEESEYWYNTIAEAKAACEIHAATGQFPPGVEPAVSGPNGRK